MTRMLMDFFETSLARRRIHRRNSISPTN